MAYSIDLYDLADALVAQAVPFHSATASWELDGPGALEVSLHGRHMAPETPTSGLVAWWRADRLSGLADGAKVSTWTDSSGAGRHATQSDPTVQPTYLARGIGGRPTVRFEGTGIRLQATLPSLSAVTVLVVGRYTGAASAQSSAFVGQTASPDVALQTDPNDQAAPHALRARHRNASGAQDGLVTSADAYGTLEPWVATITWDGAQLALYVGGQLIGTAATADPTALAATWRLGFASGLQAAVDLAEVAVWSGVLSAPDRAAAERAAAWRWGLTSPEPLWLPGRRRVVLRDGAAPIWGGWLLGLEAGFDPDRGESWTARCLGHAAGLADRVVLGDVSYTAQPATTMAWNLISHAQSQPNGGLGITLGTVVGTAPSLTRHYCDTDPVLEAIEELASREPGGFDWEVDAERRWNAWVGGRGTDRTTTVSFRPEDVRELRASFDGQALATYAHALGQDPDGPCGPAMVTRQSSQASTYLRRDAVVERDTSDAGELTAAADHELQVRARARLRLEAVVEETHDPAGLRSLALGDKVRAYLPVSLGGTQDVRLISRQLSLEDRGIHHYTLGFEVAS